MSAEATTAESSRRALVEVLGVERRDRILAALYLVRQDGVVVVRQSSIQIWKALVHNTPRTGVSYPLPFIQELMLSYSTRNSAGTRQPNHFPHIWGRVRTAGGIFLLRSHYY